MYHETQRGRGLLGFLAATAAAPTVKSVPVVKAPTLAASSAAAAAPSGASLESATEAAALKSVCPSGVGKSPCTAGFSNSDFTNFINSAIQTRYLPPYQSSWGFSGVNCSGYTTSLNTDQKVGSIGGTVAKTSGAVTAGLTASGALAAGGAAAVALPVIGVVIGLITSIIGIIGAHHAQAVATQNQLLCQLVPAANQALQQIDAGLAGGSITPSQASSAYSTLQQQLASGLQSDPSYKHGDALWIYNLAMQAISNARNADLNNGVLTGGAPGPWTQKAAGSSAAAGSVESTVDGAISSITSGSNLIWLIAGAAALLFLL